MLDRDWSMMPNASPAHGPASENYNVLLYTSVLPPETVELPHLPDIQPWVRA